MPVADAPSESMPRRPFYVGDYEAVSLRDWADALARHLGRRRIHTLPEGLARAAARIGDGVNALGFGAFPFNSFRLRNVLTESVYDLSRTREVCGDLPYSLDDGAALTAEWVRRNA